MTRQSILARAGWSVWDFLRRLDEKGSEDKIFFLAGGIAFNILLAIIPLLLLLITAMAMLLHQSTAEAIAELLTTINQLLPANPASDEVLGRITEMVLRDANTVLGIGTVTFVWFSTRLFGSLRLVLADVFDIDDTRGPIRGKLFDIRITLLGTILVVAYIALTTYLAIATSRGIAVLETIGLRNEVMGGLEYLIGRLLAFGTILLTFFALYRYLPHGRIRPRTAWEGALFAAIMFELAKWLFALYVRAFDAGSVYGTSIAAVVIVVFWVYYAALIFVLGGEVAQVLDLLRVRREQREVFG